MIAPTCGRKPSAWRVQMRSSKLLRACSTINPAKLSSAELAERRLSLNRPGGASMLAAIRRLTLLAGFLFIASLLGGAFAQSSTPAPLTAQEKRGKQIYLRASSPSGKPVTAYLGDPPIEVPPSAMTCAG